MTKIQTTVYKAQDSKCKTEENRPHDTRVDLRYQVLSKVKFALLHMFFFLLLFITCLHSIRHNIDLNLEKTG